MDSQSIITQVCREENNCNSPSCVSKVEAKPPLSVVNSNTSSSGKSGQGSLLSRLLCCFRPGVSQSSGTLHHLNNHANNINASSKNNNHKNNTKWLLKPASEEVKGKVCLVVDLDETLVHSSFQPVKNADFIIPVEIDGTNHQVYVLKRPHVDEFLKRIGELFECVLFTASLGKYADPVTDLLDKWSVFQARLFRESCVFHMGNYVKDLSLLGRDVNRVVILDNSPISYLFHPNNAVPVLSWFEDPDDHELRDLLPFFEQLATSSDIHQQLLTCQQRQRLSSNGKAPNSSFPSSSSSSSSSLNSPLHTALSPSTNGHTETATPDHNNHTTLPNANDHSSIHPSTNVTICNDDVNININHNNATSKNCSDGIISNNNNLHNSNNNIQNSNNNLHNSKNSLSSEATPSNNNDNVKMMMTKKKMLIAEIVVDCNKQLSTDTAVQQQQQQSQQQQQDNTGTTESSSNNNNNQTNLPNNNNNNKQQLTPNATQQHKTSAPDLQRPLQHPTQRHSYQPISNPLHKQQCPSLSYNNIHNYS